MVMARVPGKMDAGLDVHAKVSGEPLVVVALKVILCPVVHNEAPEPAFTPHWASAFR